MLDFNYVVMWYDGEGVHSEVFYCIDPAMYYYNQMLEHYDDVKIAKIKNNNLD